MEKERGILMFCANCGSMLEDGSMFCSNCGSKIESAIEDSKRSEEQSSEIEDEQSSVVEEQSSVEAQAEEPVLEETQPMEEVQPMEEILSFCNTCGVLLDKDCVFCANCGSRFTPVEEKVPQQPEINPAKPMMQQFAAPDETPKVEEPKLSQQAAQTPLQGVPVEQEQVTTIQSTKKRSKKGLVAAIIVFTVLVLGAGGFLIFSKITLGKLGDSVAAFKTLATEKGLEDLEEYATLIKDGEEKSKGWIMFGASDLEKKLDQATTDCIELSDGLIELKAKRSNYENLSQSLILEGNQEGTINDYLAKFDEAITLADTEEATKVLSELEDLRSTIINDNTVSIRTLMDDLNNYNNSDFSQEDWDTLNKELTIAENYILANEFVKAKDQILNCSATIASIEEKIANDKEAEAIATLYAKPQTLTVMISQVMYDDVNYRNEFEKALEAEIGIDIEFAQIQTENYYDAVNMSFVAGVLPDVVYLSTDMYKEFQHSGVLTDLTDYWYDSELLASNHFYGEETMERLKIDGRLYGFTPVRGSTCVTYIRKSWLDKVGLSVPKTYDEFYQMLAAFTEKKVGGKGTYGMTAPGFLENSEPYTSFLQPFYQNAVVDVYQNASGEWVDGFAQQEMVDALYRLQEAYQHGYLDKDMAKREVNDAIAEFGSGKCGVISLWEGIGADLLTDELKKNGIEDDIIVMEPLAEMGSYIGGEPGVFVISSDCKSPGGVVKYFFEPMLDGGAVQKLWTYGVEGYHWNTAEATTEGSNGLQSSIVTLPYPSMNPITYNYNLIDPLRALAYFKDTDPGLGMISDIAVQSSAIANQYYKPYQSVKYSESYWNLFGQIQTERVATINKIMVDGIDPITALEEYQAQMQYNMEQVLSEMNQ